MDFFYWAFLVACIAIVASFAPSIYISHLKDREAKKAELSQLKIDEREWRRKMADRDG